MHVHSCTVYVHCTYMMSVECCCSILSSIINNTLIGTLVLVECVAFSDEAGWCLGVGLKAGGCVLCEKEGGGGALFVFESIGTPAWDSTSKYF